MLFALIVGTIVGFGLSIPPGPISVAVIKQGIQGNFSTGLKIGVGASFMDVIYAMMSAFASSALIVNLEKFSEGHAWFEITFQVLCIIVLIILGVKYFKATTDDLQSTTDKEVQQEERAKKLGVSSPYLIGIIIAITNLANPPFLPSLIGVAGFLQNQGFLATETASSILYAVGFGIGVFLWFMLLLRIIIKLRERLPITYFTYIFKFAGGAFFLFAGLLIINVLSSTEWSTLF